MILTSLQNKKSEIQPTESTELTALIDGYATRYREVIVSNRRCTIKFMLLSNDIWLRMIQAKTIHDLDCLMGEVGATVEKVEEFKQGKRCSVREGKCVVTHVATNNTTVLHAFGREQAFLCGDYKEIHRFLNPGLHLKRPVRSKASILLGDWCPPRILKAALTRKSLKYVLLKDIRAVFVLQYAYSYATTYTSIIVIAVHFLLRGYL